MQGIGLEEAREVKVCRMGVHAATGRKCSFTGLTMLRRTGGQVVRRV